MTKSTIWKLIFIFFIVLVSFSLISPFEDRELGEYAESQAGTTADPAKYPDHVSFSDVTTNVRAGLEEGQDLNFESLRNYGKENKLDMNTKITAETNRKTCEKYSQQKITVFLKVMKGRFSFRNYHQTF